MHFTVMVTVGKIVLEVELSGQRQRGHTESGRHDTGGAHRFAARHRGDTLLSLICQSESDAVSNGRQRMQSRALCCVPV